MDLVTSFFHLLSDYCVCFDDGMITWDGHHHAATGLHVDNEKVPELTEFATQGGFDDLNDYLNCFVDGFLNNLVEADEDLIVPRSAIHEALYPMLREGDLTGLVLADFCGCNKALVIDNPAPDAYCVMYDTRIARGIPQFFNLVTRMLWDMRQGLRSQQGASFKVTFVAAKNVDLSTLVVDDVTDVPGVQEKPGTKMVYSAPAIQLDTSASDGCGAASAPAGGERPGNAGGDRKVAASEGDRVWGNAFSVALPDGWIVDSDPSQKDTFVLSPASSNRRMEGAQVLYSWRPETPEEMRIMDQLEVRRAVIRTTHFPPINNMVPRGLEYHEVQGDGCIVAVVQVGVGLPGMDTGIGLEFYVYPLYRDNDGMRVTFYSWDRDRVDEARTFVDGLASTVRLNKVEPLSWDIAFKKCFETKVEPEEFRELAFQGVSLLISIRQGVYTSAVYETSLLDGNTALDRENAGLKALAQLNADSERYLDRILDAVDAQERFYGKESSVYQDIRSAAANVIDVALLRASNCDLEDGRNAEAILAPSEHMREIRARIGLDPAPAPVAPEKKAAPESKASEKKDAAPAKEKKVAEPAKDEKAATPEKKNDVVIEKKKAEDEKPQPFQPKSWAEDETRDRVYALADRCNEMRGDYFDAKANKARRQRELDSIVDDLNEAISKFDYFRDLERKREQLAELRNNLNNEASSCEKELQSFGLFDISNKRQAKKKLSDLTEHIEKVDSSLKAIEVKLSKGSSKLVKAKVDELRQQKSDAQLAFKEAEANFEQIEAEKKERRAKLEAFCASVPKSDRFDECYWDADWQMRQAYDRKRKAKTDPENKRLAKQFAQTVDVGEVFTLYDMMDAVDGIDTFSKAGVVCYMYDRTHSVKKVAPINNRTAYVLTDKRFMDIWDD